MKNLNITAVRKLRKPCGRYTTDIRVCAASFNFIFSKIHVGIRHPLARHIRKAEVRLPFRTLD